MAAGERARAAKKHHVEGSHLIEAFPGEKATDCHALAQKKVTIQLQEKEVSGQSTFQPFLLFRAVFAVPHFKNFEVIVLICAINGT